MLAELLPCCQYPFLDSMCEMTVISLKIVCFSRKHSIDNSANSDISVY